MDLFKANFLDLRDEAATIAYNRAVHFLEAYLKEMAEQGHQEIPEGKSPDFQYVLYQAQKEYARTGDQDLGDLLVQLLIDRTEEKARNLTQIVLNESLIVAPKLTSDQLDALSLIFYLRYTKYLRMNNLSALHWVLDTYILPFASELSLKESTYQHLEFASCGTILLGNTIQDRFLEQYPGLFSQGFTEERAQGIELPKEVRSSLIGPCLHNGSLLQVVAIDDETIDRRCNEFDIAGEKAGQLKQLQKQHLMSSDKVREYLTSVRPTMENLCKVWEETPIGKMSLTSVGIAIAHANIKRKTGSNFDLSIWF